MLLKRGLVDRFPRNTRKRGFYYITQQGKDVLAKLEELQPYPDEFTDEQRQQRFLWRHEVEHPDGTTTIEEEWIMTTPLGDVAHRGYKWITIELLESIYWMDYFSNVTW